MILDGHVHIRNQEAQPKPFLAQLAEAGIDGAALISLSPRMLPELSARQRLENLMEWTDGHATLFPLFWLDPTAEDATEQVALAVQRGVAGFKVLCSTHPPGDVRAMPVYRAIAEAGKPILFHSGILWDGLPSGPYNRPCLFESLLEIDNLKFTLAHISWPWVDECIAAYGKFLNAYTRRPDLSVEMFIDNTPGTPPIYRRDALTKLFTVGYDIEHNIIFGTDCRADDYNVAWAREWITRDNAIYDDLGLSCETREHIYADNLRRFLGLSDGAIRHRTLRPAE
jgi:predicted TIM-barrel fold metal-dependent hydrolase